MDPITDEFMNEMLARTRPYTICLLKKLPARGAPGADEIVREHGRRNFALRAEGILAIVCPVSDGSELAGVGVFTVGAAEVAVIMDDDPAVRAGIFSYEVHPTISFPGDGLPELTGSAG